MARGRNFPFFSSQKTVFDRNLCLLDGIPAQEDYGAKADRKKEKKKCRAKTKPAKGRKKEWH